MDEVAFVWCREKEINKHVVDTVSGEALASALVLSTISASIYVACEGLQGRVMEVYLGWSSQLKKKQKTKVKERNSDHCGLEIGIGVKKFFMSPPFSPVNSDLK